MHRQKIKQAAANRETFVQFINFLLNDTSFLLDEAMAKLAEIHKYQFEQDSGLLGSLSQVTR